jgi:putative ABC transport system substrate-binding protein
MRRREFLGGLGGAAAWPLVAQAQQAPLPVIAFLNGGQPNGGQPNGGQLNAAAFRKGLSETGFTEARNVLIEYHWMEGKYDSVPSLVADIVRRRVAVIVSPGFPPGALAAKATTTSIPIVFGVGDDPVKLGLVSSVARPGGNVTGVNFLVHEAVTKRSALLHELVPKAIRIAVLFNPGNAAASEQTVKVAREAATALGLQILAFGVSTVGEIDETFVAMARERIDALLIAGDGFLNSRRGQFATLAIRDRLPMVAATRETAEAGGLLTYGASVPDMFRQVGIYAGSILKGTRPADLPVLQSTKFEFIINLQTAKALGITVPPSMLAMADEVIE